MIRLLRLLLPALCLCALLAPLPLRAEDVPQKDAPPAAEPAPPEAPPMPPPPARPVPLDIPMEAYGTAHPECLEWTDSCRSCRRDDQNIIACATPGIACLPQEIVCVKERGK